MSARVGVAEEAFGPEDGARVARGLSAASVAIDPVTDGAGSGVSARKNWHSQLRLPVQAWRSTALCAAANAGGSASSPAEGSKDREDQGGGEVHSDWVR